MRQHERQRLRRKHHQRSNKKRGIVCVTILFLGSIAIGNYLALVWIVPKFHKIIKRSDGEPRHYVNPLSIETVASGFSDEGLMKRRPLADAFKLSNNENNETIPGVVILSMHRSGSSLLAGLLVKGLSYKCPGSHLLPDAANPRGYYENANVVMQNEGWLQQQDLAWDNMPESFDIAKSCSPPQHCPSETRHPLNKALLHYNLARNTPWVMKDPRLCITLPSWLHVLEGLPAVLFTFRNPLEVASSLRKRNNITMAQGFRLWISYNKLAIRHSRSTCRVITSNKAILKDSVSELTRINKELSELCRLPLMTIDAGATRRFVDSPLMTSRNSTEYSSTSLNDKDYLQEEEQGLHNIAAKIFADMENGEAFYPDYPWPSISP